MLKIYAKRIDKELPMIVRKTADSLAYDLYVRQEAIIRHGKSARIPLNMVIKVPDGYGTLLLARSSLFTNHGVILTNGAGLIDLDYCGEKDELTAEVVRLFEGVAHIARGERIAQLLLFKAGINDLVLEEVDVMSNADRGGFGSTGR